MREKILTEIDIKQVIAETVNMGDKSNKIPCPFPDHDDHEPSFVIYPDSFYCFGCKRGGTVIDFIMYRDGVSAGQAMKWLCERYNLPMPEWTPEERKKWEAEKQEKAIVEQIFQEAAEYYHQRLTPERREYFHQRGLTDETIDKLKLGYADGKLLEAFQKGEIGKHNEKGLLLSGLFRRFKNGNIKDVYQRRYILPYWNKEKVVYFIGRLDANDPKSLDPASGEIEKLPKWNQQKYYKLPVYHKDKRPYISRVVKNDYFYGEDSIGENDIGIITEGVIDCIHLLQAGYSSISPVTEEFKDGDLPKLAKLAKHWKTVYIANDNEESGEGERGAVKTGAFLFEKGIDIHVVTLPRPQGVKKVDVADFFNVPPPQYPTRKNEFQNLLDKSPAFVIWQINRAQKLANSEKREMTWQIFSMIANCDDKLQLQEYADLMHEAGLVANTKIFNEGLKEQRIKKRKADKAKRMKFVEETDPALHLKLQIEEIRKSTFHKAFEIKKNVCEIILNDMRERGKFYQTVSSQYFWFENEKHCLYQVGDDKLESNILNWYGINGSEKEYEYVNKGLKAEAITNGEMTEIHRFSFYDKANSLLYVYNNDDRMYKLDGKQIELVDNGIDGVLFIKNRYWEPFEYVEIGDKEFINPLIIEPINFTNGELVTLNKAEQSVLFLYWIYSMFFESIQPTKPIMALVGPKGSGKTTILRIVGKILLGSNYNVTPLTKDDDFDAAISNNAFVFYDNVDSKIDWLNDRLAHTATGKMIQKRELYTTNENVYFFPKCFISLNSREPKFKRDDVTDRLLLFRVERLESFHGESTIINNILAHRNELMSELLNDLNNIVEALAKDKEPFATQHRMADWADLGWRIAKINGQEDDFVRLLEKMDKEQSEFLLEDHPISLCLDEWMLSPINHNREMDTGSLYREFQIIAEQGKVIFPYKNTQSFGMQLRNILSNFNELYEVYAIKKQNRWHYNFKPKES